MLRKGPYIVGIGESFQVQHLLFYFGTETRGEISRAFLMNGEKYISSKSNWNWNRHNLPERKERCFERCRHYASKIFSFAVAVLKKLKRVPALRHMAENTALS